ncbi:MAG: SpoIIE family protein phosphatase [Bacteroidetes bacterium]|nr:SpoIIE family protein phosphatase [Bacteroidota bacterium]
MDNTLFRSYLIEDRSYVSFIKREIHNTVKGSFSEGRTGEIDIIVSELTSNVIKHAQSGELLYKLTIANDQPVFEILCIDHGPGMKSVNHSLKDGYSSTNTLGQGLGSIIRLSNEAQFYSMEGWGTIAYARLYPDVAYREERLNPVIRCLNVAKPGEQVSGDGGFIKRYKDRTLLMLGDGLGHGPGANEAVTEAIKVFQSSCSAEPTELIREMNQGVKRTRGLVATVAVLDHKLKKWSICGVGNIHTRFQRGLEYKNYICNNGIIGLNIPGRLESATFDMEKLQYLILCSDGIRVKWDLLQYPGILKYDPIILAAVLYKDQARRTDDMTVLIARVT